MSTWMYSNSHRAVVRRTCTSAIAYGLRRRPAVYSRFAAPQPRGLQPIGAAPPLRRCLPTAQARHYASFIDRIPLNLADVDNVIAEPQRLAGCRDVQLTFCDWPKWKRDTTNHSKKCHAKLSHALGALDSAPNIDSASMTLSDVLSLPLRHSDAQHARRTPKTIFSGLAIDTKPVELGNWKFPDHPTVRITDPVTVRLMHEAQRYREDLSAWEDVVAKAGPAYQAFDYTASFYAGELRYFTMKGGALNNQPFIDFGPYGGGRPFEDLGEISVRFARDLTRNTAYFARTKEWRPRMYDEFWEGEGDAIFSCLEEKGASEFIRFRPDPAPED